MFLVLLAIACLPAPASGNGSDLPTQIVLQGFIKPEGDRLRFLVRIPLVFIQPFAVPKRGPGYLDLARVDGVLREAGAAAGRQIEVFENGARLAPTLERTRISVLSDRSFDDYGTALARMQGPPLAIDTDLFWNQGFFDAQFEYPIRSPDGHFSVSVNVMPELGRRVQLRLQFLPADGGARTLQLTGGSTSVALDPRGHEAAWLFVKDGFVAGFTLPRVVLLLCLIAPFRRFGGVVAITAVMALLQSLTTSASALGLVVENHWLAAFTTTSFAVSILVLAVGNLGAPSLRRRWFAAAMIGAIGGFALGGDLAASLQLGGSHRVLSVAAFDVGSVLAQIVAAVVMVALLRIVFRVTLGPALGVVIVSALSAHAAWHAMFDTFHELAHEWSHTADAGLLSATTASVALWMLPALLVGGAAIFLPRAFGGPPYPTVLSVLGRREDGSDSNR